MTKHDEVRQILNDTGCEFADGRSALEMTDEEVEKWMFEFVKNMTKLSRELAFTFKAMTVSITQALEPLKDLGQLLEEAETSRDIHGV